MTEIKELLANINMSPACLTQIDWVIETEEFAKYRIIEIMRGIIDVELRKLAGEYIADSWYDTCECCTGIYELEDYVGHDDYEYRFEPKRKQYSNRINCISIEDFIQEQLDFCKRDEERKQKLQQLQLKFDRDIASLATCPEVNKELIEGISRYAAETVLEKYEELDLEECAKQCPKIEEVKRQASTEAIRELVEQIVIYAEDRKPLATRQVIQTLLLAKSFNHHIPDECLNSELHTRISNLGKEEVPIKAEHYYASGSTHQDHSHHLRIEDTQSPTCKQIEQA